MRGLFKEFVMSEMGVAPTNAMGASAVTPAVANNASDPDDRKKAALAQDAKMQLTKAKTVMGNPSANPKDRQEALKKLQNTKANLNNVAMQDAIGDIEKQLNQISPNMQIGAKPTPPGAI